MAASSGRTVVEQLPHSPKIKGSSQVSAAGTERKAANKNLWRNK